MTEHLICATTWINPQIINPPKIIMCKSIQTESTQHAAPFTQNCRNCKITCCNRWVVSRRPERRCCRERLYQRWRHFLGCSICWLSWRDDISQVCKYVKMYEITYFKYVSFCLLNYTLLKALFKCTEAV